MLRALHCLFTGAVVEAHARAVAASVVPRATKGIPGRTMDMLTQELMFVLEGSDGAAERCAAMESLFWLQVSHPMQEPSMFAFYATSGFCSVCLPLMQPFLSTQEVFKNRTCI